MKRLALSVLAVLLIFSSAPEAQAAPAVTPSPPDLDVSPVLITGYGVEQTGFSFVQLYNNSSDLIGLEGWSLDYDVASDAEEALLSVALEGWILPREYVVVANAASGVDGADLEYEIDDPAFAGKITKLQITPPDDLYLPYQTNGNLFGEFTRYEMVKTSAGNYTTSRPFAPVASDAPLYGGGLYFPPADAPLKVVEIFANSRNCAPLETDPACNDFVKLYNPTGDIVDLNGYRMRVGWGNQTAGINNAFNLSGELAPGGYLGVATRNDGAQYDITASGGVVWLEDAYGLTTYAETLQPYGDIGGSRFAGYSWAFNSSSGKWQWALPNPIGPNNFAQPPEQTTASSLVPCRPGQERNPATNRCRSVAAASTQLKPCKPGQTRNPDTNRCRSTTATSKTLVPCKPGQERNPATNRCRKVGGVSTLKPCGPGQERNPETNRCRKVAAVGAASLPNIHDIQAVSEGNPLRWWIAGGAVAAAAAYGLYEWRRDIAALLARLKNSSGR